MRKSFNAIRSAYNTRREGRQLRKAAEEIGRFYSAPPLHGDNPEADVFVAEKVSFESLPEVVKELLPREGSAKREMSAITDSTGLKTYIVTDEWFSGDARISETIRVFDVFRGARIGHTYFQYTEPVSARAIDALGIITQGRTKQGFEKRGLGERRLIILDQFCQNKWDVPVNSSAFPSHSAKATWNKLVRRKLAFFDERQGIYRFIRHSARTASI